MKPGLTMLGAVWADFQRQWRDSALVRLGAWSGLVLVWIYALLMVGDWVASVRADVELERERIAAMQPLARDKHWDERLALAKQQAAALDSMLWREPEVGLAEAAVQDFLRSRAASWQLQVRELGLKRDSAALAPGQDLHDVRARLVMDLQLNKLLGFLAEVSASERTLVVERLQLRLASQPPTAEVEVRALARIGAKSAGEQP